MVASGRGANSGIILRKVAVLEVAPKIDTVVFDKTGTLTTGEMKVQHEVLIEQNKLPVTKQEILMAIHSIARESNHPVALKQLRGISWSAELPANQSQIIQRLPAWALPLA